MSRYKNTNIKISKSNFTFYSPITSMVIISVLLTIIINLFQYSITYSYVFNQLAAPDTIK